MSPTRTTHFRPDAGYVGDVIPFEHDGLAWLFYLLDERPAAAPTERESGMPWAAVTTTDFAGFDDQGVVLPSGGPGAGDFDCYTGSVVTGDDGVLHLFYTGHNPRIRVEQGQSQVDAQIVCHATSDGDPRQWSRHPEWDFGALDGYAPGDWRDPFVFRTKLGEPWQMLLATRRLGAPYRRSGIVARLVSEDLVHWREAEPFWEPHRFITQECPDVFQWGNWWYLVYSEFSDSFCTRYRIADAPEGPWRAPADDSVDGRAFYAAKTLELNGERYFIGWIATKAGGRDGGPWQWAGTMSVLQARQRPDGSLSFDLPTSVKALYTPSADIAADLVATDGSSASLGSGAADRYRAWLGPQLPAEALVAAEFDIHEGTQACGVLLRTSEDGESGYALRLEPQRNRLVLDRWPRDRTGDEQWQIQGDVPHAIELERPVQLAPGPHRIEIQLDGDICVAVADGEVALSARLYDRPSGRVGVFAQDGGFELARFEVRERTAA